MVSYKFGLLAFFAALLLYGALGSPTPDHPGWIEAIIGVLLLCSVTPWHHAGRRILFIPLMLIGLTYPLAVALIAGRDAENIIRDVIPFLFLCLPLFIFPQNQARAIFTMTWLVGVMFAARVLGQGLEIFPPATELLYLANSPLVLMAAITGLGQAGCDLYRRQAGIATLVAFAGGLVCLLAMLVDVQRATITAVILSLGVLGLIGLIRAPGRMLLPLCLALLIMLIGWDAVQSTWQGMASKTAMVGVNMRWQELIAVWERINDSAWTIFFGIGWGGMFESPAVGGVSVPFTHSLLSYMTIKTGLLGLVATLIALAGCTRPLLLQPGLMSLALIWAITIPVFFYASYKSLDFGLVLMLALLPLRDMRIGRS